MAAHERFKTNFNNPALRQDFFDATGIKAEENPSAFIGYINNIILDALGKDLLNITSQRLK